MGHIIVPPERVKEFTLQVDAINFVKPAKLADGNFVVNDAVLQLKNLDANVLKNLQALPVKANVLDSEKFVSLKTQQKIAEVGALLQLKAQEAAAAAAAAANQPIEETPDEIQP